MTRSTLHTDWLTPDWPAPANVRAVCTTRAGGVSIAPYDSLNLGDHVGDDPAHVAANRAIFQQTLGATPVFLNQVHGTKVLPLAPGRPDAGRVALSAPAPTADAAFSGAVGMACTIMVADCLPVLFTTPEGDWVAAAHAGWRGLAGQGAPDQPAGLGVLEATCVRLQAARGSGAVASLPAPSGAGLMAWLGPCIGPTAFEVGDEVCQVFVAHDPKARGCFTPLGAGKWLADLAALARQRLAGLGVTQVFGNDSSAPWCTFTQASRFFSYRRDGLSGRMAVSIWRSS